jgi:hypothetical protein
MAHNHNPHLVLCESAPLICGTIPLAAFLLELEACVDGLTHGVNFLFNGRRHTARFQRNHGSARRQPSILREAVEKSIRCGHSVGPFSSLPWANLQVHPLGLVPKSSVGGALLKLHRLLREIALTIGPMFFHNPTNVGPT